MAGVGRGQLMRVKPGGVALHSSELEDEEVIQVMIRQPFSTYRQLNLIRPIKFYISIGEFIIIITV